MPRYSEIRKCSFSPQQMFDLVTDVEEYPEFLPWCLSAKILSRREGAFRAVLTAGFGPVKESFISHVRLSSPERVDVTYEQGPFRYLKNCWKFKDLGQGVCEVDFFVDFEFRSLILRKLAGPFFTEATKRMANAFLARAEKVYERKNTRQEDELPACLPPLSDSSGAVRAGRRP